MNTQVKVNYSEPLYTYSQWKVLESRKNQSRRVTRVYFIKQKLSGLVMIAIGIIALFILNGDATFSLVALPLGLYLIFTKLRVMTF